MKGRALVLMALLCCSGEGSGDAVPALDTVGPGPGPSPDLSTFAYGCGEAGYVVAHHTAGRDSLWLFLPDSTVSLAATVSGSGAKYQAGGIAWWNKGGESSLEVGDRNFLCSEQRRRSIMEDAKLRGADFWATGNEPGWTLEVFHDRLRLVTAYGADLMVVPYDGWLESQTERTSTARATAGNHRVIVTLSVGDDGCRDSMSGERFETEVVLELDGALLYGCGQALH